MGYRCSSMIIMGNIYYCHEDLNLDYQLVCHVFGGVGIWEFSEMMFFEVGS